MKYINPGFPQVFQYQTMNDNTIGDDPNHEVSVTGFFTRLSENDMDVFYKETDLTKEFWIMFDLTWQQSDLTTSFLSTWTKIFDFYNDADPTRFLQFCYRQYQGAVYEVAMMTSSGVVLGNTIRVRRNELNTFELHVTVQNVSIVEIFLNGRLKQTVLDTSLYSTTGGSNQMNRVNFYCQYVTDMNLCLSHVIYNDTGKIGNERIHMLTTDLVQQTVANGSTGKFKIIETLDTSLYKDIVDFGIVSKVENEDSVPTEVTTYLEAQQIDKYIVKANAEKYSIDFTPQNTETGSQFTASYLTNKNVNILTDRK